MLYFGFAINFYVLTNCFLVARNSRVVGFTHAVLIVPLAWKCIHSEVLDADRAYGWDSSAGIEGAVASG